MSDVASAATEAAVPGMGIATSSMDLLGTILDGAFNIVALNKQQQLAYQQFLADTFPEYKEFFKFENKTDYRNVYIIVAMVFVMIVLIIAITLKEKENGQSQGSRRKSGGK